MMSHSDYIIDINQLEDRVCSALSCHIKRYRPSDFPFINGRRVAFLPIRNPHRLSGRIGCSFYGMSDITDNFYFCLLFKNRLLQARHKHHLIIDTWSALFDNRGFSEANVTSTGVTTWADVVETAAKTFNRPSTLVPTVSSLSVAE